MAHFAKIDSNNTVRDIIVISNDVLLDEEGVEQESLGREFIASIGLDGVWVQCSYNGNSRGTYPAIGFVYDEELDEFVRPVADPLEE